MANMIVTRRFRRKLRVRRQLHGTADRPRLTVTVGSQHVSVQLVDDTTGTTLASSDSRGKEVANSLTAKAKWVGSDIAAQAKRVKITRVVFDRNGHKYHGRVKALAEQARQGGLEF